MFCSKTNTTRINKIQKRTLRTIYEDYETSFEEVLCRSKSSSIHIRNLIFLMTEIDKSGNFNSPPFMADIFKPEPTIYNVRTQQRLIIPMVKSVANGYKSITFKGSIIWKSLPNVYKYAPSLTSFKLFIKQWNGDRCNCQIMEWWWMQLSNNGMVMDATVKQWNGVECNCQTMEWWWMQLSNNGMVMDATVKQWNGDGCNCQTMEWCWMQLSNNGMVIDATVK